MTDRGVGSALRRLRPLLPDEARGRGHRRDLSPRTSAAGCSTATPAAARTIPNRQAKVPDCIKLTPQNVTEINWIPNTCAYRRIAEGRGWPGGTRWSRATRRRWSTAGVSVRGRTVAEDEVTPGSGKTTSPTGRTGSRPRRCDARDRVVSSAQGGRCGVHSGLDDGEVPRVEGGPGGEGGEVDGGGAAFAVGVVVEVAGGGVVDDAVVLVVAGDCAGLGVELA